MGGGTASCNGYRNYLDMDYNKLHADWAMQHQSVRNGKVLVVGCNTGLDCRCFVEGGAQEVHGVDVDEAIGRDYAHPAVRYFRTSAEKMDLPSDSYDLVHCFATMEHIPDIQAAFNEMARVTRGGGTSPNTGRSWLARVFSRR